MAFRLIRVTACAFVIAVAAPGRAADSTRAESLFQDGLDAMLEKNFARGCPAIAESLRLEPLPGTLFTLAECEAGWGKFASAQTHYSDYLRLFVAMDEPARATQKGRDELARQGLARIEERVPTLRLTLSRAARGARVLRDGVELRSESLDQDLAVDPGEHRIRVELGERRKELVVRLGEGEHKRLVLELPPAKRIAVTPPQSPLPSRATMSSSPNVPAWISVGVGVVGLGVGGVAGGLALGKKGVVDDNCSGSSCNDAGLEGLEDGRRYARISTAGFIAAGIGFGVAAVLFLIRDEPAARSGRRLRPALVSW